MLFFIIARDPGIVKSDCKLNQSDLRPGQARPFEDDRVFERFFLGRESVRKCSFDLALKYSRFEAYDLLCHVRSLLDPLDRLEVPDPSTVRKTLVLRTL